MLWQHDMIKWFDNARSVLFAGHGRMRGIDICKRGSSPGLLEFLPQFLLLQVDAFVPLSMRFPWASIKPQMYR